MTTKNESIVVTILSPTNPPSPMFQREFKRSIDADDYESFWQRLGHCYIGRTDDVNQEEEYPDEDRASSAADREYQLKKENA